MKRTAALGLAAIILAVGAGSVASASSQENAGKQKAIRNCLSHARIDHPDTREADVIEAAKPCIQQAGASQGEIDRLTKRAKKTDCREQAEKDHPEATRTQVFNFAKPCLQAAGVPPEQLDKTAKRLECRKQANSANPDATDKQLGEAVRRCIGPS